MKTSILFAVLLVGAGPAVAKVKKPLMREHQLERVETAVPFDPSEATRQIRARMGVVRACYMLASRLDPGLSGKLQLGFDIADSGQVAATQVEVDGLRAEVDASIAAQLTSCIRTQALNWRLSPEGPAGGAHVSYVFVFAGTP